MAVNIFKRVNERTTEREKKNGQGLKERRSGGRRTKQSQKRS
jgi:hypothetical protein